MKDNTFKITFENFYEGFSPLAHTDSKTFFGSRGQASEGQFDIISRPGFLTQSPALANLTNGTQAGVVDQLIRFILDKPTATDTTYAVGTTKLFKLSSTTVTSGGSPSWPQTITNMTEGESVIRLKANVYILHNKASGGDIAKMPISTEAIDNDWGSTTPTGAAALQNAPHPVAVKEDIMGFGNGRYAGFYIENSNTIDVDKLDFGEGTEVVDILFNQNVWWIAVNSGSGERKQGQIYLYDGSALSNILVDEAGIGIQEIGFLYLVNGIVYVAYKDLTTGYFVIGYLQGRQLSPLRYFTGSLPDHRQKTFYLNTILYISSDDIWSCGAPVQQLPVQISNLADAGYATVGGLAAPFGVPIVASSDGGTNHRLAKLSGYATTGNWKSIFVDVTGDEGMKGHVNKVIVYTKELAANAVCEIVLEDQLGNESSALTVNTDSATRHIFTSIGLKAIEDMRIKVTWSGGDASADCPIRKIVVKGNFEGYK